MELGMKIDEPDAGRPQSEQRLSYTQSIALSSFSSVHASFEREFDELS